MFSDCTMPPDSKETKLGSSNQKFSPSPGKKNRVVLTTCRTWKFVPTAIFGGGDTSEVPGCHLLRQQMKFTKITSKIGI